MRTPVLTAGLALCLVLAGCLGTPAPATRTSTDATTSQTSTSQTSTPSTTCTMTGGYLVAVVPIDPANATAGEIVAFENLSDDHREAFDRMLDGDYQGHPFVPDWFPAYVRYNGTVYEPARAGTWDQFC